MKLFKIFLTIYLIIFGIVVISRFFPHTYSIERSIIINKPVHETFVFMSDFKNWEKWSLWNKSVDPSLGYFYNKKTGVVGAKQYFYADKLGKGHFEIIAITPDSSLSFILSINRNDHTANGTFVFTKESNNNTKLSWIDSGDVGNNPIKRFMIPMVKSNSEQNLDASLQQIKKVLESE